MCRPHAQLVGTMCFVFACFGGACPGGQLPGPPAGDPLALAPEAVHRRPAAAPAALGGPCGAGAHGSGLELRVRERQRCPAGPDDSRAVEGLMRGVPAGRCADQFQDQWGALRPSSICARSPPQRHPAGLSEALANLAIARDDARNYMVLGDPAARLRIERYRRRRKSATETQSTQSCSTTENRSHRDPERTLQIPTRRTPPSAAARLERRWEHKPQTP